MSYELPNVGRLRAAEEQAMLIAMLPGAVQNREAALIVRCANASHDRSTVLCRVFRRREGLLFVPAGRVVRRVLITDRAAAGSPRRPVEQWQRPEPYWLDEQQSETIRARCRCCPPSQFSTADMLDHLRRGRRVMRLPVR